MFFPAKTPFLIKKIFHNYIWNINSIEKTLYLTFDDGPTPIITDWVLEELDKFNAKATFFCIGKNITLHQEIFKRIVAKGHGIGNHTYNHINGWRSNTSSYIDSTKQALKEIEKHKITTNLFRPPYGKITASKSRALKKEGYHIIMWDVLSKDWNIQKSKNEVKNNVLKNVKNGSIIVFHDSKKAEENMKYALSETLKHFSNLGYTFKVISAESLT